MARCGPGDRRRRAHNSYDSDKRYLPIFDEPAAFWSSTPSGGSRNPLFTRFWMSLLQADTWW